jgi:hypothetical protein
LLLLQQLLLCRRHGLLHVMQMRHSLLLQLPRLPPLLLRLLLHVQLLLRWQQAQMLLLVLLWP